ncbi:MAG: SPFH domain-containing protein [Chloroflexota bacterium]
MSKMKQMLEAAGQLAEAASENEQFMMDVQDFMSSKESGGSSVTQLAQLTTSLADSAQVLNSSHSQEDGKGGYTNIISPVVMPKDSRSWFWVFQALVLFGIGIFLAITSSAIFDSWAVLGGPHYWILWLVFVIYSIWKNSYVMIPDGCQALITRYGKVEETVGPGRKTLLHPMKRVGYIVNTTKEYPYNAPIREAPTQGRVDASVDLFLQFRIEDPSEFIFTEGGVNGFSEKLQNVISEVTRALIYEQRAEDIYDLVGESTQPLLDNLNKQFAPAVRFVNANITHAEPSSAQYRMDLAAAEVIRVEKEAYTYQYELNLRKEQDEGDLNKELASLQEELSVIQAEVAGFQAQIDTARQKATNQANAYAHQLLIEAESEANANSALLKAQALDIKAINSGRFPEILEHRFQIEMLNKIEAVADKLPQVINIGPAAENSIDFMSVSKQMMGLTDKPLYTQQDIETIRGRINEIRQRVTERNKEIKGIVEEDVAVVESISAGGK